MAKDWKRERAKEKIDQRIADVEEVEIVDYTRTMSLENISVNKAYRMEAVHLYADILNMDELLATTQTEGEQCHKRTLRFLNQHYRAVDRVLRRCDAMRVDFHNQRLHAVVAKPYGRDAESDRVDRAVAIAQLIIDVLNETGDTDENIPNAVVRVGIDTGLALAVNNGRNNNREPLFLGSPANHAAKHASNGPSRGVYLTNEARLAIGLEEVDASDETALSDEQVSDCQAATDLDTDKDEIVEEWRDDMKKNPIGGFSFTRPTPPLRDLDISVLTPWNSRRFDGVSVYADIDEFTAYVDAHIDDDEEAKDVVRCLHVIRSELDRVLTSDFGGRRVRFIGDCIHGLLLEGTAQSTDVDETITSATKCVGALRSSFDLALERLRENGVCTDSLGLAIGFEFGPMTVTRLGIQGRRIRCSVSRGVIASEAAQKGCEGDETAIGENAYGSGSVKVREIFGQNRVRSRLTYDKVVDELGSASEQKASASVAAPAVLSSGFWANQEAAAQDAVRKEGGGRHA